MPRVTIHKMELLNLNTPEPASLIKDSMQQIKARWLGVWGQMPLRNDVLSVGKKVPPGGELSVSTPVWGWAGSAWSVERQNDARRPAEQDENRNKTTSIGNLITSGGCALKIKYLADVCCNNVTGYTRTT